MKPTKPFIGPDHRQLKSKFHEKTKSDEVLKFVPY